MAMEDETPVEAPKVQRLNLSKSWKTYLFEFVSIALAVFMGFVAENFREEMAERQQTAELAQNLYDELRADSITVERILAGRARIDSALFELKNNVRDMSVADVPKEFVKNFYIGIIYGFRFQPTDVVLEQLKNSGSLRYFKGMELQQLTRDLGAVISRIHQRNEIELEFGYTYIIPFNIEHIDQEYILAVSEGKMLVPNEIFSRMDSGSVPFDFKMNNAAEFKKKNVINMILIYRNLIRNGTSTCSRYLELNTKLLAELRRHYDINN